MTNRTLSLSGGTKKSKNVVLHYMLSPCVDVTLRDMAYCGLGSSILRVGLNDLKGKWNDSMIL